MNEIICPHCTKAFKIDETGYAEIVKQVRDSEFDRQLHERLELADRDKQSAVAIAIAKAESTLQKVSAGKDIEIQALESQLKSGEDSKALAVSQAVSKIERERDTLFNQLAQAKLEQQAASELSAAKMLGELQATAAEKDAIIQSLNAKLSATDAEKRLALNEAVSKIEKERDALKNSLERSAMERLVEEVDRKDK